MMLPGSTISPPNFLTPSRRPALSRPLRDEPPAFLCAILSLRRLALRRFRLRRRPPAAPARRRTRRAGGVDLGDPQDAFFLSVAVLAAVIVAALLFEDDDLDAAALLDKLGADRGAIDERRPGRQFGALAADHQDLAQFDRGAGFADELLDRDHVVLGDLVLFAAGADHCKHDRNRYRVAR